MKTISKRVYVALLGFGLACFNPFAHAVLNPLPDGGYPGGNTAEGLSALSRLSGGTYNTAVGWLSLTANATGSYNTAVGAGALLSNTAGSNNTGTGLGALFGNTTGSANTATGNFALFANTIGTNNTANGASALVSNIDGIENTAIGAQALGSNTDGSGSVAVGDQALVNNITGGSNTAIGQRALSNNTTGINNIALGPDAGILVTTANDVICIGVSSGANISHSCFVTNIRGVMPAGSDPIPVYIDGSNQLGTKPSACRFKKDVQPMDEASETILALRPVKFHYKTDAKSTPQFGLIAEEVEKVNPDLVVRDADGQIYTVRYEAVNAMLLNEFLKEHKKVEEQQATIAQLESTVARQQKRFAKQDAQIQTLASDLHKVSAQLELSKFTRVVAGR